MKNRVGQVWLWLGRLYLVVRPVADEGSSWVHLVLCLDSGRVMEQFESKAKPWEAGRFA